jgi:hypothetical protein
MLPQASARCGRDKGRPCSSPGRHPATLDPISEVEVGSRTVLLCLPHIARSLVCGAGEQKQVSVRIFDDEVSRAPWLLLERLEERDVRGLEPKEKLLNLIGRANGHCRRYQFFAVSELGTDHGAVHTFEIEQRPISLHLCIERRLSVSERNTEAELLSEEVERYLEIRDKQFRLSGDDDGLVRVCSA